MEDPRDTSWEQPSTGSADWARGIPILGSILGGMGMKTTNEINKQRSMRRAMDLLAQYRPEQLETRQNALDNAMKLFQPVNRAMVKLYGPGAAMPLQQASQSPFSDRAMADMRTAAANTISRNYYQPQLRVPGDTWKGITK